MATNLLPGLVDCIRCPYTDNGFVVPGRGPIPAPIMFVGEAPGREEHLTGLPFIGAAGKLLSKLINLADIDEEQAYVTNVMKHWPGSGNPSPHIQHIRACEVWLKQEIVQVDPAIIVLLGKTAITAIAPDLSLQKHHGQKFLRMVEGQERTIIPMYHPAAALHNRSLKPIIEHDFTRLLEENLIPPPVIVIREDDNIRFPEDCVLAVDLETTGLDPEKDEIVAASWSWENGEGHVTYNIPAFIEALKSCRSLLVFHNAQFDMAFLAKQGVEINPDYIWDTMLSGYVLGKERLSLKGRAMLELGYEMETFEALAGEKAKDASLISQDDLTPYAATDASVTGTFFDRDVREISSNRSGKILSIQHSLIPVLDAMRRRGILVDREQLERLKVESVQAKQDAMVNVWEVVGHDFNIDSTQQLRTVLFEEMGLKALKRTKGKTAWSTDKEVLKFIEEQHPIGIALENYREISKMAGTYINPVESHIGSDGRIHPTWIQIGAQSGRLSCEKPNAQNQPSRNESWKKKIRGMYIAAPGHILFSVDYSQVELRVVAALSGDKRMREIYESGGNIHEHTLHTILRLPGATSKTHPAEYKLSKNLDFGMIYRLSDGGLQRYLRNMADIEVSLSEAHEMRTGFLQEFSGLMTWEDGIVDHVLKYGWVETLMHHRRYFLIDQDNPEESLKAAINHPVQGTAGGDIMRSAMIRLAHMPIIINAHDELVFELPENELNYAQEEICGIMIETAESLLNFPVEVDTATGRNWGELD